MKKSIIALAIAGLSTAALAQSNVTIYGVADVSGQGTSLSTHVGQSSNPSGSTFNLKANDSFLGFKGTEDLGNGNKALFQVESYVNLTGGQAVSTNNGNLFGTMRDSFVGYGSKYGTALAGYLSTPYRATVNSFDVFPGDRSDSVIENVIGKQRFGYRAGGANVPGYIQADSTVRATALAYAMPTFYGIDGSIAYTGSNNNGTNNQTNNTVGANTQTTLGLQDALALNLGWSGYGVAVKGAFSQAKVNATLNDFTTTPFNGYTSYLVGVQYTGIQGLKTGVLYNRNSLGTNAEGNLGAMKGSNNQVWAGASYRFGNNEPRVSYVTTSDTSGIDGIGQDGGTQWNLGWGYYLSKRTQVYGMVTQYKNNANGVWSPMQTASNMMPTGGQTYTTYGAGLRTNF